MSDIIKDLSTKSNTSEFRMQYTSVVNPQVVLRKNTSDTFLWGTIKISSQPFDIRTCDINNLFVFDDKPINKRLNWGKAILYNYVGIKLEKAKVEGEFDANSNVEWDDITSCIDFENPSINNVLKPGCTYYCENYVDIVAAHNMLFSNYLPYASNSQYYNFNKALNFNKYLDVNVEQIKYDVDDIILNIRNNDPITMDSYYVYGTPTSSISSLEITLNYKIYHNLTSVPQTYKLTVGNPSGITTPFSTCFYHKGTDKYYTYVDDSFENIENGEILLYYDVRNVDKNKIKMDITKLGDGNFKNIMSNVKFIVKKNVIIPNSKE